MSAGYSIGTFAAGISLPRTNEGKEHCFDLQYVFIFIAKQRLFITGSFVEYTFFVKIKQFNSHAHYFWN